MTHAIPVWGVAGAIGLSALEVTFFAEIGGEFVAKAALAFHHTALSELKRPDPVRAVHLCPEQAKGHQLLEGYLYMRGFEVQQTLQLCRGDVLAELFAVHPVHHL